MTNRRPANQTIILGGGVVVGALGLGRVLAIKLQPVVHSGKLTWVLGRGLGLAALLSMTALVAFGVMIRHPRRSSWLPVQPATVTNVHAALGGATVVLVAAHLAAMALDPWAHIGWVGALVPGMSSYRPVPVSLGVSALYLMLLIGGTARMAGRLGRIRWLRIHRLSWLAFTAALFHGLTTGSDTYSLRLVYAAAGGLVVALVTSAKLLRQRRPARREVAGGAR